MMVGEYPRHNSGTNHLHASILVVVVVVVVATKCLIYLPKYILTTYTDAN
jgi:hypothetical protein